MKLSDIEVSEICRHLCESNPKKITQINGGNIHIALKIEFKSYKIFAKINKGNKKLLKFENFCLNDLQKYISNKDLLVPKVIGYLELENSEILLMEWIDMVNGNEGILGKGIAKMHLKSHQSHPKDFGYSIDGYIGKSNQIKGWEEKWLDCFSNLRIEPQLKMLQAKYQNIPNNLIEKINSKIKTLLSSHTAHIALIHGDLWSGNKGISTCSKGVIFDPACYWADSESDIAMTKLFGGFNNEFYEEYFKIIPQKKDFDKRIIIYNFYHILNHANIFGGGYMEQVRQYIQLILNM